MFQKSNSEKEREALKRLRDSHSKVKHFGSGEKKAKQDFL